MKNKIFIIIASLVVLTTAIFPQKSGPRKQMQMNFQKVLLYHCKSTSEYYLVVAASDDSTRQCRLDLMNVHVILEDLDNKRKTINNEDLKAACLGNMYSKVIGQKYTLFRFNLIIDNSGSIDNQSLQFVQQTLKKFIELVPLVFEAQVIRFASDIQVKTPFTKDKQQLIDAITQQCDQGGTALYDAIDIGVQELKALGDDVPLRFTVVLTDGNDTASRRNNDSNTFKSRIIRECQDNLIPLFVIGVTDGVDSKLLSDISQFGMYQHITSFPQIDQAFKVVLNYIKDVYIFKIPAIGDFSKLKTIYIVKKTAAGNYDTIQDIIVN